MTKVWGRASSVNVQKVMWALGELDIAAERVDLGGPYGGLDDPAYLARNPHGRIPTIETDEGVVMWESNAIVRHLAMSDPARRLWPADGQARADPDMWAEWAATTVQPAMTALFVTLVFTRAADRDASALSAQSQAVNTVMGNADRRLATSRYLGGDTLTIADIVFGSFMYRFHALPFEREAFGALSAYTERLQERPAYRAHAMVDFSELMAR